MQTIIDSTTEHEKSIQISSWDTLSYCFIIQENGDYKRQIHIPENSTFDGTVIVCSKEANIVIDTIIEGDTAKSHLRILALAKDESKLMIRGIATVEKPYRKAVTRVDQTNILLGKNTQVRWIPELKIATDDIEWGHSCKVHRLGGEALFYLQSRWLDTKDAESLLLSGEIQKHLDVISDEIKKESLYEEILRML